MAVKGSIKSCITLASAALPHPVHFHTVPYRSLLHAAGENVKEFFFRVASLAFETNVLAELEKSGSRQIGDVVREYPHTSPCNHESACHVVLTPSRPFVSGISSTSNNVYASSKKKQPNCCQ